MRRIIYSRHGSSHLGERGKRKKRKPITGKELEELIELNKTLEENENRLSKDHH